MEKKWSLTKKEKKTLSAKCLNYVINKTKEKKDVIGVISKLSQDRIQHEECKWLHCQTHLKQGARENKSVGKIQPKIVIIY